MAQAWRQQTGLGALPQKRHTCLNEANPWRGNSLVEGSCIPWRHLGCHCNQWRQVLAALGVMACRHGSTLQQHSENEQLTDCCFLESALKL